MIRNDGSQERTGLWLVKAVTGLLIVVILGVHFVVNHVVAPGGLLSYQDVINYYQNPLIPVMEIAFLIFVVSHALIGLRSILLDISLPKHLQKIIDYALIVLGSAAVIYGIWLVFVLVGRGKGA